MFVVFLLVSRQHLPKKTLLMKKQTKNWINKFPYFLLFQDTIRNPSVMDFIDRTLQEAPFSSKHILNFLHNGPPEDRPADMPDFDWRDIFNLTDRVIRMLNQYGDVSGHYSKTFILLAFPSSCSRQNYLRVKYH